MLPWEFHRIAKENNVSPSFVIRAEQFMKTVELMEKYCPGIQEEILSGKLKLCGHQQECCPRQSGETGLHLLKGCFLPVAEILHRSMQEIECPIFCRISNQLS